MTLRETPTERRWLRRYSSAFNAYWVALAIVCLALALLA